MHSFSKQEKHSVILAYLIIWTPQIDITVKCCEFSDFLFLLMFPALWIWLPYLTCVHQVCILSPCLCNLFAEYIMRNARLDEAQAGIKIARRNVNNLRYADNITLMAESEEELKSLLMKVKEESERVGLKFRKLRSWHLVPSLHGK